MIWEAVFGGVIGFTTVIVGKMVQKVHIAKQPWEHLIGIGIGAFAGKKLYDLDKWVNSEYEKTIVLYERRSAKQDKLDKLLEEKTKDL